MKINLVQIRRVVSEMGGGGGRMTYPYYVGKWRCIYSDGMHGNVDSCVRVCKNVLGKGVNI